MKKEFKKQMDLTKNIGQEPEPKKEAKPAAKKAVKAVKAEAPKKRGAKERREKARADYPIKSFG